MTPSPSSASLHLCFVKRKSTKEARREWPSSQTKLPRTNTFAVKKRIAASSRGLPSAGESLVLGGWRRAGCQSPRFTRRTLKCLPRPCRVTLPSVRESSRSRTPRGKTRSALHRILFWLKLSSLPSPPACLVGGSSVRERDAPTSHCQSVVGEKMEKQKKSRGGLGGLFCHDEVQGRLHWQNAE